MKKLLFLMLFVFSAGFLSASEFRFDDFAKNVDDNNLKPFAKDLGGLMGSGTYSTGRILGWGGFQLSGRVAVMPRPNDKNNALGTKDDADFKAYPWIQGEIGLPFRLDGYIRASSYDGLTVAGGGLKWAMRRPTEILYTFQPMLVVLAESGVHKDFAFTHYGANMVIAFRLPYVVPYVGGGVDYMKLTVEGDDGRNTMIGKTAYATTARGTAGFNIKLPAYMDLSLAANYANYGFGAEASFGVRF